MRPCAQKEERKRQYTSALIKEIRNAAPEFDDYHIPSVTVIGSEMDDLLLRPNRRSIVDNLLQCCHLTADAEYTFRADPCPPEVFAAGEDGLLRENSRIELRILSFDDRLLSHLGRHFTCSDAEECTRYFLSLNNCLGVSALLLTNLPGQTEGSFEETLEKVCSLGFDEVRLLPFDPNDRSLAAELFPPRKRDLLFSAAASAPIHISSTLATSPFPSAAEDIPAADENSIRVMQLAHRFLPEHGFRHVGQCIFVRGERISQAARMKLSVPCYLGLGAGAATFMSGSGYRNTEDFSAYCRTPDSFEEIAGDFIIFEEPDLIKYTLVHLLTLPEGLTEKNFRKLCPADLSRSFGAALDAMEKDGLLTNENGCRRLTPKGFCNIKRLRHLL